MKNRRWFVSAFVICAIASLGPIWAGKFLPLTDLPQHIAQISILRNYSNPVYEYGRHFELNFFTPYALGLLLGAALNLIFPLFTAAKILLSLIVISFPLSMYKLLVHSDGDPQWSLLGFPLAFGGSFFWGHLPYLAAVPLSFFCWGLALKFRSSPSPKNGFWLSISMLLLFFSHVLPFAISVMVITIFLLEGKPGRVDFRRFLPLAPAVSILIIWLLGFNSRSSYQLPIVWQIGWHRLFEMPQVVMGIWGDRIAHLFFIGVLIAFYLFPRRQKAGLFPFMPLTLILFLCLALPFQISMDINYVPQRIAVYLFPAYLLTFRRAQAFKGRQAGALILMAVLFIGWSGVLSRRVIAFNKEAASFAPILEKMAPNRRVAGIILDKKTPIPSYLPYLHFPAYYQALKGGTFEYSFSNVPQTVARYPISQRLTPSELSYSWDQLFADPQYDYYLFRLHANKGILPTAGRKLLLQSGPWFLFERIPDF